VHYEFVSQEQSVNQQYYIDTVRHLKENVQPKGPAMLDLFGGLDSALTAHMSTVIWA
jgi:hypothetical protein